MRAQGVRRTRLMIWLSLGGIAVAAALVALMVRFASQNPDKANLGSRVLRFDASRLADDIARDGPFLLKDPLNRGRDVFVQHTGADDDTGWVVVDAYASQRTIACLLRWSGQAFVDPCSHSTYPPDGAGLHTVVPEVVKGSVRVSLSGGD